jgi:copper chaperone
MPRELFTLPNILGDIDLSIAENSLRQINGVQLVEIHPTTKQVTIEWDEPATWEEIQQNLDRLGYTMDE